jgi:hypothetical protein
VACAIIFACSECSERTAPAAATAVTPSVPPASMPPLAASRGSAHALDDDDSGVLDSERRAHVGKDCAPCSFQLRPASAPIALRFEVRTENEGRVIERISVSSDDASAIAQALEVHDMEPVRSGANFVFGGQDIKFDGYNDLFVVTRAGAANVYADYWLFNPTHHRFDALGNYPLFEVDARRRVLRTDENMGHGGREYVRKVYAFIDGALTMLRAEQQTSTQDWGTYERTISLRRNGKLRISKRERLHPE